MATEKVKYELTLRDLMSKGLGDINSKLGTLENKLKSTEKAGQGMSLGLGSAMKALTGYLSVQALASFGKEVITTTARFQSLSNSIKFASDTAVQGESSMIWIADMSKKLGLPLEETTEGFKTLQGAMLKTKFSSGEVRTMFRQVSTGVVAMGLSAEDAKGTFLALGQIMGKGKVQAEELRGQIGERIPGAFSIAARAMGKTTAELDKMMKDGDLLSEDFLPKFAAEMEKTFGGGVSKGVESLTANINRLENSWTNLFKTIGDSNESEISKGLSSLSKGLDAFTETLKTVEQRSRESINPALLPDLDAFQKNKSDEILALKKKGKSKEEISKYLESDREGEIGNLNNRYGKNRQELNKLREKFGKSSLAGSGFNSMSDNQKDTRILSAMNPIVPTYRSSTQEKLLDEFRSNFQGKRDFDTYYKELLKGKSQGYDKIISDLYNDQGVFTKKSKTKKELEDASGSVSGAAPKTVNINIEGLIKGTVNNIVNPTGEPTKDLQNFLSQLKQGLLTVVNDVNIIQQ